MIAQPEYERALFIFNDNQEQFEAFLRGDRGSGCGVGSGNGAIRPYQCRSPRRAAGVPTGSRGAGYQSLTPEVKGTIDRALDEIKKLMSTGDYDVVYFSQASSGPTLGAGTFVVGTDVKDYIYRSLLSLGK